MNHKAEAENQNQLKLCIFNEIETDEGIKERDMTLRSIREKNHPIHVDGGKIATKMLTLIAFTNRMCVYESLNFPLPNDFYQ